MKKVLKTRFSRSLISGVLSFAMVATSFTAPGSVKKAEAGVVSSGSDSAKTSYLTKYNDEYVYVEYDAEYNVAIGQSLTFTARIVNEYGKELTDETLLNSLKYKWTKTDDSNYWIDYQNNISDLAEETADAEETTAADAEETTAADAEETTAAEETAEAEETETPEPEETETPKPEETETPKPTEKPTPTPDNSVLSTEKSFTYTPTLADFNGSSSFEIELEVEQPGESNYYTPSVSVPITVNRYTPYSTSSGYINGSTYDSSYTLYVKAGQTKALYAPVDAETGYALSYVWKDANGNQILDANGAPVTTSIYNAPAPADSKTVKYTCEVTARYGEAAEADVQTFYYKVALYTNNFNVNATKKKYRVTRGENVALTVDTFSFDTNTFALADTDPIVWYKDDYAGDSSKIIAVSDHYAIDNNTRTLTVSNIQGEQLGYYTVRFNFKRLNPTGDTNEKLYEDVTFRLVEYTGFKAFSDTEKDYTAKVGDKVNISVVASNNDPNKYPIVYEWYIKKNSKMQTNETNNATKSAVDNDDYPVATKVEYVKLEEILNLSTYATVEYTDAAHSGINITPVADDFFTYGFNDIRCIAKDTFNNGTTQETINSATFDYTIEKDFSFAVPDKNRLYATYGQQVTLTVSAQNVAGLNYQWVKYNKLKDDYEEILGANASVLTVGMATSYDFTTYRCIITDSSDKYYTKNIDFEVVHEVTYSENITPTEVYAKLGDTATFQVRGVSDNAADVYNYQWYKGYEELPGEVADTLTVSNLTKESFGNYYCVVRNVSKGVVAYSGNSNGVSSDGNSYVKFNLMRYVGVTLSDDKTKYYANAGEQVTFNPTVSNVDNLPLEYVWTISNNYVKIDDDDNDNTSWNADYSYINGKSILSIQANPAFTTPAMSDLYYGTYYLNVYYEGTMVANISYEVDKPNNYSITAKYITAEEQSLPVGGTATMTVEATTNSGKPVYYQWYYGYINESEVDKDGKVDATAIAGANTNTFTIAGLKRIDLDRYYSCVIYDGEAYPEVLSFHLVRKTGQEVEKNTLGNYDTKSICGEYNKSLTLAANTTAVDPQYPTTYTWYYLPTKDASKLEGEAQLIYGAKEQTYTIESLNENTIGLYYCKVENTYDTVYVRYFVYVNSGLKVKVKKDVVKANIGKKAVLQATVSTDSKFKKNLVMQWSKYNTLTQEYTDIAGATEAKYTIDAVTEDSYGSYKLSVTDGIMQVSRYITLSKPLQFGIKSVKASTAATLPGSRIGLTANVVLPDEALSITTKYTWYVVDPLTDDYIKLDTYKQKVTKKKVTKKVKVKVKGKVKYKKKKVTVKKVSYKKFDGNSNKVFAYVPELPYGDDYYNLAYKVVMEGYTADGQYAVIDGQTLKYDEYDYYSSEDTVCTGKDKYVTVVDPEYTNNAKNLQSAHNYEGGTHTVVGYKVVKANKLQVKFDKKTSANLYAEDVIYVINSKGVATKYFGKQLKNKKIKVKGNKFAILLYSKMEDENDYGFKVTSVKGANKGLVTEKSSMTIAKGDTAQIVYSYKLKEQCSGIKFTTSKKAVATVTNKGVVTAKKKGKTVITLKKGKKKAKVTITVK
ncbi:MAG: immunoglobulin domain-containing protein [Lachnospiraceae bacterium]|nr:immunoglobulin domain-containing protein [Lachnospiraceae bacterium]